MATLIESYRQSYAKRKKAYQKSADAKIAVYQAQKEEKKRKSDQSLRSAYLEAARDGATRDQRARAAGRSGGAVENEGIAAAQNLQQQTEQTRRQNAAETAQLDAKIKQVRADEERSEAALALALEKAEQNAAKSAAKSSGKSKKSSSGLTNSQIISLMSKGIYQESFAKQLGVSDRQVRDYVAYKQLRSSKDKAAEEKRRANSRWYANGGYARKMEILNKGK